MENNELYLFLNGACKKKKLNLDDVAKASDLSRSTIYRLFKGKSIMTDEIERKLEVILGLTTLECDELRKLVGSSNITDSSIISSRHALEEFMFGSKQHNGDYKSMKFAFYDKVIYLKNYNDINDELINQVSSHLKNKGFECKIRIIDCLNDIFYENLTTTLEKLRELIQEKLGLEKDNFRDITALYIEHLLAFSKSDYSQCTKTLLKTIPLLNNYDHYKVFYSNTDFPDKSGVMLGDVVLIEISSNDENNKRTSQYFLLSFIEHAISQCIKFTDESMFNFFIEIYESFKLNFNNSLNEPMDLSGFIEYALKIEKEMEYCIIKPDICYTKVSYDVCKRNLESLSREQCMEVYSALQEPYPKQISSSSILENSKLSEIQLDEKIRKAFQIMTERCNYAFKSGNIDICSKSGLLRFATSGKLSDHLKGMPPFSQKDLIEIFEHLIQQIKSPNGYRIYITEKDFFVDDSMLLVFKNFGMLMANSRFINTLESVFVRNDTLTKIFYDFAENHIPDNYAITDKEAIAYLEWLMDNVIKS